LIAFTVASGAVTAALIGGVMTFAHANNANSPFPIAAATPAVGVLDADTANLSRDQGAGITFGTLDLNWSEWEPQAGVFNASYIASEEADAATFRANGWTLAVDLGLEEAPAWALALPGGRLVDQNGVTSTVADFEFSPRVRAAAATYIDQVVSGMGLIQFYRIGLSENGEDHYPDVTGDGWWSAGPAQGSASSLPAGVGSTPLPGWIPGQSTFNGVRVTSAQVTAWYAWYFGAMVNAHEWEINTIRSAGFSGYLELVTPGVGALPPRYNQRIAEDLAPDATVDPSSTLNSGAVWWMFLQTLQPLSNTALDISSVYDSSGTPLGNGCQPTDASVNYLTAAPAVIASWSSTRWLTYLANGLGLPVMGENSDYMVASQLNSATALAHSCGLLAFQFAQDHTLVGSVTPPGMSAAINGTSGITASQLVASWSAPVIPVFSAQGPPGSATVGTLYSYVFAALAEPPLTFSLGSGTLPPGVRFSPTGTLSGVPTSVGTYSYSITVTDPAGSATTASHTITVAPGSPAGYPIFTAQGAPGAGTINASYSYTFTATGASPVTFALGTGSLPPGLNISTGGTLSGVPTTTGAYTYTIVATDTAGSTSTLPLLITVTAVPPVFTAQNAPGTATVGTSYSFAFAAFSTDPPLSFALGSGTLPPGVTLSSSGALSGTPTATGLYSYNVVATDLAGSTSTGSLSITVSPSAAQTSTGPPVFTAEGPLGTGTVGTAYSYGFTAIGAPPITFALGSGSLPPGMTISSSGVLSGSPTTVGLYTYTVLATGPAGSTSTGSLSMTVGATTGSPVFTADGPAGSGNVGTAYSYGFTAVGASPITFALGSGSLPPGMTISSSGVLSGSPTTVGLYTYTVLATGPAGSTSTRSLSLTVIA
jgi:hypothetical protein